MRTIKVIAYLIILSPIFFLELILYKLFKIKCSNLSHQYMIKLFVITGGLSNQLIHKFTKEKKKINLDASNFDLKSSKNIENHIKDLNYLGYSKEESFLSEEEIKQIKFKLKNLKGKFFGDHINDTTFKTIKINV